MSGMTLSGGTASVIGTGAVELTETGGRALKLQTDTPHLVSMGGGRLSTAVTLHPIPQGRVTLGSGPGVDIPVQGTGVLPLHCHIENSEGVVTIYPLSDNLSIDGVQITVPTRLSQGVMLTIGRSNIMRFNHPAEAKLMKSVLPNSRISMTPVTFDVDPSAQNKKKPPTVPRKSKSPRDSYSDSGSEDPPSSIMTKVSKFEYLAAQNFKKSISPKVFSSNLVTVNTPAKDVLGKAPPDLQSFSKHLPQSALNYSDLNYSDKPKLKTPDRQLFGRKSPQYVNVTVNETKSINNRVIIYENGCGSKPQNINRNDLNNFQKSSSLDKNVNMNRPMMPSPGYNRNPAPYFRSATASPVPSLKNGSSEKMNGNVEKAFGSLDDLAHRKNDAEMLRNKAQADRIKEQEIEKAEQARLEEILNMCAEYEKQVQHEKHNKPTPNRIKTNGSLPRDKRQCPYGSFSPPPSPRDPEQLYAEVNSPKLRNHSYENVTINSAQENSPREKQRFHYENVELRTPDNFEHRTLQGGSPYENVVILQSSPSYPHSPRTKIKTFIPKDSGPKDPIETENKLSVNSTDHHLQKNISKSKEILIENTETLENRKATPTKFILPLDDPVESEKENMEVGRHVESDLESSRLADGSLNYQSSSENSYSVTDNSIDHSSPKPARTESDASRNGLVTNDIEKQKIETLRKMKQDRMTRMAQIKRQLAEIEIQEEELNRELDMERALIAGEHKSKLTDVEKLEARKQRLLRRAQKIEASMRDCHMKQEQDQDECKRKLEAAQEQLKDIEEKLAKVEKPSEEYNKVFEEYLFAQEYLDNEKKIFEDLEFHQLEEEADWLASREELQREIMDLSHKIENLKIHAAELDQQKLNTSKANTADFKVMERQRVECLVKLEAVRNELKVIDSELHMFTNQESEQEVSSDSDSDKSKECDKVNSDVFSDVNSMYNLSCSMIEPFKVTDDLYNMSQSFNEKLLQEKSILEGGLARKFPSQDDIDRISKVAANAPISIDEQKGSLGRKTIESLKEIELKRHQHLCQRGSQVIEHERQRMQALKEKVQQEVRSTWAQRKQDCSSLASTTSEEARDSSALSEEMDQKHLSVESDQQKTELIHTNSAEIESPRPLSETSELSVEVGATLGRRRPRQVADKHRPLTRYLPIRDSDLDLRQHIESAGHQVVLCPHVTINSFSCRGFLHKKGSKLNGWSKRWFVFDRNKHTFVYYADKTEKKPRGGSYFQAIEEVYLDHLNSVKSPNPNLTFIVKTHERFYHLMAPSPEAMRIWVDVIFTGAEGYQEFEHGS